MDMSKSILLIGGNGYIGSRIYHDLNLKYNIKNIDLVWFGNNIDSEVKDFRHLTTKYLEKFDIILLFAGHSSVKMCDGPVLSCWNNNVNNFINLIKKIDKSQLLIYSSSGSVYGSNNLNSKEDFVLQFKPINNYDLTKYTIDIEAKKFISEGYNIVGLRFGTVNGFSPNTREELMLNSMIKSSIVNKKIIINNKTINRPILGLNDLVYAVEKIISNPIPGIYNLASFTDNVENFSKYVSNYCGSSIIETVNVGNNYDFIMDTEKFTKAYNFRFTCSPISLIKEIIDNFDNIKFSNRNIFINYEYNN
jgi:nucleoside-diphosphate-sugar epimerase